MVVSSFFVYLYRKKQDTDKLQQLIVQKRELLARETFSRRAFNRYEDMSLFFAFLLHPGIHFLYL